MSFIGLWHNQITTIESNAFEFTQTSNSNFEIYLNDNYGIIGDSFEDLSFNTGNSSVILHFGNNPGLKYLKQSVFQQFLEKSRKNVIDLEETPLDYYEDNRWLLEYKRELNLTDRIIYAKMVDGVDLWQSDPTKFTKIRGNNSTLQNN